ncbi:metallophosphoesterase [Bifidobacterium jacchi]|uniref:Serine/threonine protein phosphatase n=1 Tax=Bifidobacterium jacchi TaxID=2490545 RepID=A0A5N5RCB4_9BIFI|nr:metallophosphoesterase [Bifidobacterium jacchi]KAB5604126.1 serine/threonine protein phosphatase [Bifidobacterium jacchi]
MTHESQHRTGRSRTQSQPSAPGGDPRDTSTAAASVAAGESASATASAASATSHTAARATSHTAARTTDHDTTRHSVKPLSISSRLGRLRFHRSGKFRVLQLADIQDGPNVAKDTIRLIEAALDASRPDLVVFTGNQIAGYDTAYAGTFRKRRWEHAQNRLDRLAGRRREIELERTRRLVTASIARFVKPLIERGVPWVVTYGNHDFQCGLDNAELDAIYREFGGCVNPPPQPAAEPVAAAAAVAAADANPAALGIIAPVLAAPRSGLPDQPVYPCSPGTFAMPVLDADDDRTVMGLVLLDSGDYARDGGYGSPSIRDLDFVRRVMGAIADANSDGASVVGAARDMAGMAGTSDVVADAAGAVSATSAVSVAGAAGVSRAAAKAHAAPRSLVFQHMPLPQFYGLLRQVPATADRAIEGYRTFTGRHYVLDESRTQPGSYLGEGISCPDHDSGEWGVLQQSGDCFGVVAAHDHRNGFVGTLGGMMLVATPTCGFGSYGPAPEQRAARLFEFDIRHPYEPRTQLLQFGDLVGKPSSRKAYAYDIADMRPDSEGMDLLRRPSIWRTLRQLFRRR